MRRHDRGGGSPNRILDATAVSAMPIAVQTPCTRTQAIPCVRRCGQAEEGEQVPADHHGVPLPATTLTARRSDSVPITSNRMAAARSGNGHQAVLSGRASAQAGIHLDQQDTGRDQGGHAMTGVIATPRRARPT